MPMKRANVVDFAPFILYKEPMDYAGDLGIREIKHQWISEEVKNRVELDTFFIKHHWVWKKAKNAWEVQTEYDKGIIR